MNERVASLAPPKSSMLLLESRAALDAARMLGPLLRTVRPGQRVTRDSLVIVVPGFGSGDSYTLPLRRHLRSLGYRAEGWGLGTNLAGQDQSPRLEDLSERWNYQAPEDYRGEAGVPFMIDRLYDRVCGRHEQTGMPVVLIGWSLGGYMAREVARDLPDVVERVVTMGSPIVGGPKYTAVAPVFERSGQDLDWIEAEIAQRSERPINQPITAIFSKTDGIVSWQATIDHENPNVEHIEVDAAHLGMGFNRQIWGHVASALEARHAH